MSEAFVAGVAAWFETYGAAAAAATTAAGAGTAAYESKRAGDQQERAADRERRMAEIKATKARRRAIAQTRIQQGQVINEGAVSGAGGSSSVAGGVGSLGSDLAGNIGYQNTLTGLNNQRLSFLGSANQHLTNAGIGSAVSNIGGSFGGFNLSGSPNTSSPPGPSSGGSGRVKPAGYTTPALGKTTKDKTTGITITRTQ